MCSLPKLFLHCTGKYSQDVHSFDPDRCRSPTELPNAQHERCPISSIVWEHTLEVSEAQSWLNFQCQQENGICVASCSVWGAVTEALREHLILKVRKQFHYIAPLSELESWLGFSCVTRTCGKSSLCGSVAWIGHVQTDLSPLLLSPPPSPAHPHGYLGKQTGEQVEGIQAVCWSDP